MTAYCEECDTVQPVRVLHDEDDCWEPGEEPVTICCACGAEVND